MFIRINLHLLYSFVKKILNVFVLLTGLYLRSENFGLKF